MVVVSDRASLRRRAAGCAFVVNRALQLRTRAGVRHAGEALRSGYAHRRSSYSPLARNSLAITLRMVPNSIVLMLYVELGLFLGGLGCLTVARMAEVIGERAPKVGDKVCGERRGLVMSRLGT